MDCLANGHLTNGLSSQWMADGLVVWTIDDLPLACLANGRFNDDFSGQWRSDGCVFWTIDV